MNYRHAFHAGNLADVMKHIVLARVIEHLKRKAKPFRFIDTHAGIGLYDLDSDEATRSGEAQEGVERLLGSGALEPAEVLPGSELATLLWPYFDVLRTLNGKSAQEVGKLRYYPGSCELARRLMREEDRLVLNELHPADSATLHKRMIRDDRVRTMRLDGWMAVKSLLPPKERRSVVLIDPPFEETGEFARLEKALSDATERFATGVTILWYPIKAGGASGAFLNRLAKSGHKRLLAAELLVHHRDTIQGLNGSGLVIHNPPFKLDDQMRSILPWLSERLGQSAGAGWNVTWLAGE